MFLSSGFLNLPSDSSIAFTLWQTSEYKYQYDEEAKEYGAYPTELEEVVSKTKFLGRELEVKHL